MKLFSPLLRLIGRNILKKESNEDIRKYHLGGFWWPSDSHRVSAGRIGIDDNHHRHTVRSAEYETGNACPLAFRLRG